MFDNTREDVEETARETVQTATKNARDRVGERAVDATEQAFPEEYQRRQRSAVGKAFVLGVAIGAGAIAILRR